MNLDKHNQTNIFHLWDDNAVKSILSGEEIQYDLEEDKARDFSPE